MLWGVHLRNDYTIPDRDLGAIREMRLEAVKGMAHTDPQAYATLRGQNPQLLVIVRLWDADLQNRFFNTGQGELCPPGDYATIMAAKATAIGSALGHSNVTFQIHNEPNHTVRDANGKIISRYEGWGDSNEYALSFNNWYRQVYTALKQQIPWATFGFPGLAVPHRDVEWIEICRESIEMSDWLGCHCYWQNFNEHRQHDINQGNHLQEFWGGRYRIYAKHFPKTVIHILEAGNSNHQSGMEQKPEIVAEELMQWYAMVSTSETVQSANPFLLSSPDPTWANFAWIKEDGSWNPIVERMRHRQ